MDRPIVARATVADVETTAGRGEGLGNGDGTEPSDEALGTEPEDFRAIRAELTAAYRNQRATQAPVEN